MIDQSQRKFSHHDRPKTTEFFVTQTPSSNPRTPMLSRVRSVMTTNLRSMFSKPSFSVTFGRRSSGVDIQSLVDGVTDEDDGTRHKIQGIGVQDLGVFYHGFAQALVPLLDRAQVSCTYLMLMCRCCTFGERIGGWMRIHSATIIERQRCNYNRKAEHKTVLNQI